MPNNTEMESVASALDKRVPKGFERVQIRNMVVWQVPLSVYPDTYNKQALWLMAIAPQKNYNSLHFMPAYANEKVEKQLHEGFKKAGKKLDMGKACIRFKKADDLDLDTIGDIVSKLSVKKWVEIAKSARK